MARSCCVAVPAIMAFVLIGCAPRKLEMTAALADVTPQEVVFDVQVTPAVSGVRAGVNVEGEVALDDSGRGQVRIPRAKWAHYDATGRLVLQATRSGLARSFGFVEVTVPTALPNLLRIPESKAGSAWAAIVGGGSSGAVPPSGEAVRLHAKGEGPALSFAWHAKEATLPILVAAPSGTRIEIGAHAFDAGKNGLTRTELPVDVLALSLDASSLNTASAPRVALPLRTTKDGATQEQTFALELDRGAGGPLMKVLAARLARIAAGEKLSPRGPLVDAVVIETFDGQVEHAGVPARVEQAALVGIERKRDRAGQDCSYTGTMTLGVVYEDVDLDVFDAAGNKIATKHFDAPPIRCPSIATSKDRLRGRPSVSTELEWLTQRLGTSAHLAAARR